MTQYAVYLNKNLRSRAVFPLLVDVQSELLEELATRVVIPLARYSSFRDFPLGYVMPTLQFEGERYVLLAPQVAGVPRADLGPHTGSAASQVGAITTAMDVLLRGF